MLGQHHRHPHHCVIFDHNSTTTASTTTTTTAATTKLKSGNTLLHMAWRSLLSLFCSDGIPASQDVLIWSM